MAVDRLPQRRIFLAGMTAAVGALISNPVQALESCAPSQPGQKICVAGNEVAFRFEEQIFFDDVNRNNQIDRGSDRYIGTMVGTRYLVNPTQRQDVAFGVVGCDDARLRVYALNDEGTLYEGVIVAGLQPDTEVSVYTSDRKSRYMERAAKFDVRRQLAEIEKCGCPEKVYGSRFPQVSAFGCAPAEKSFFQHMQDKESQGARLVEMPGRDFPAFSSYQEADKGFDRSKFLYIAVV